MAIPPRRRAETWVIGGPLRSGAAAGKGIVLDLFCDRRRRAVAGQQNGGRWKREHSSAHRLEMRRIEAGWVGSTDGSGEHSITHETDERVQRLDEVARPTGRMSWRCHETEPLSPHLEKITIDRL